MKLRILDSCKFLASSLAKLGETLKDDQCTEIRRHFSSPEQFSEIRKKGIFPYSYVDDISRLRETALPPLETFQEPLREDPVTPEEYQRALRVWDLFECKTIGDHSNIYLTSDLLLLADVFEKKL